MIKPRKDRRITTLHGALRQLSKHCEAYGAELHRAIERNDAVWLAAEFRPRVLQILVDIEALAMLAAEEPEPPYAVYDALRASTEFMVSLCDLAGLPAMKSEILKTLAEDPRQ